MTAQKNSDRTHELSGAETLQVNGEADCPTSLRVEHLDAPIGIDTVCPRLSWMLPRMSRHQISYRIQAGDWDSGRVDSADSVLVPFGGRRLQSRERVAWRVKVWTDAGESPWSQWSAWEMGLLGPDDWTASWIEPIEPSLGLPGHRRAQLLRTAFAVGRLGNVERIYATAHGIYELFLNGSRVGDLELTPGFTSYPKRLQVQTYDVSDLLRQGENELRAVVSDGWWRGQQGITRLPDVFGTTLGLLVQIEVDGIPVATTDETWSCTPGDILEADLIEGQQTDLRIADDSHPWRGVEVLNYGYSNLVASPAPPVRRTEFIRPISVRKLGEGRHVVDLGQDINGWLRLERLGENGSRVTMTHGESLDESGDVTMTPLEPLDFLSGKRLSPGQVDVVISDGSSRSFEPRHTTHGFQYARIEGWQGDLTVNDVTGVVVHTDLTRRGWFRCSDERLNLLHDAADWSFRTNACDIPTDCPQRERAGWTGDWQIFAPTAAFLYDVAGFSTKWLRDLAADQRSDGVVRNFAPDPAPPGADDHPIKHFLEGSAGWGDAAVLVPWAMWRCYGDRRLLEEQWPSMVAWVEFIARTARTARHSSRVERSAEPAPYESFLWDTGFHWGEWLEPDAASIAHFENLGRDFAILATAFYAKSALTLAAIGDLLGRDEDAERFRMYGEGATNAWQQEFLDEDGRVRSDRQEELVRALAFDLLPEGAQAASASRLVEMIRDRGTHLGTGFLATPYLLPVLADHGHLDVAYELLLQDTQPSWLAMIERGATTIWENWEGVDNGEGSLNHYSKGAVISFLHEYSAGIRICDHAPAYRCFHIAPRPGGGLRWVEAAHESPYGRIESNWSILGNRFRLVVRVPPGTTAHVRLPDGSGGDALPGTAIFECRL